MTDKTTILDVAAYLTQKQPGMSTMKLHKLLYLIQGWALAWTGEPLFPDRFRAWDSGPNSARLFDGHRAAEDRYSITKIDGGDPALVIGDAALICDAVNRHYEALSGPQLREITMRSTPWSDAWARASLSPDGARNDEFIGEKDMARYFEALSKADEVLRR